MVSFVQPEGTDAVSSGVPGSSGGRWTQTNNNSVRQCHGNPGEQSSALSGDDVCDSVGTQGRGNQGLWIRPGVLGVAGDGRGWTGMDTGLGRPPRQAQGRGLCPVVRKEPCLGGFWGTEQRVSPAPSGLYTASPFTVCVALAPVSISFPFWLL